MKWLNAFSFVKQSPKLSEPFQYLTRIQPGSNAFTFSLDDTLLDDIRTIYLKDIQPFLEQEENHYLFTGGQLHTQTLGEHYLRTYDDKPLLWISCNTHETYQHYHRVFKSLNIENDLKTLIDTNEHVRLYCGFLVVGNHATTPAFHMDYYPGANAYTLITPLFQLETEHGNLLYENKSRRIKTYSYQLNEAIILGEKFYHSTQPYPKSNKLRVLLSLTFGSDKLDYWHITKCTLENQSTYLILPCGHVKGSCDCFQKYYR